MLKVMKKQVEDKLRIFSGLEWAVLEKPETEPPS